MQRLMTKKDIIHVAFASNNNYAVLLATLIKSIIYNHHTDENIVFYILNDKISQLNQDKINSLISKSPEVKIQWNSAKELLPEGMKFPVDNSAFPFTAFLRLFAPYILDKDVKKLIYFDVDMVVLKDVSELWNIDLEGHTLAAVIDVGKTADCSWGGIPNYKELGIPGSAKYFNSGLMIIDVEKWKEDEIPEKVFRAMEDNINYVNFADQYGLNVVFAEKWLEIDPLWNWFAHNYHPNPKNIHFLDIKPIFKSYRSDESFKREFFKYLDLTPWKGMKLKSDYLRLFRKGIIKIKKTMIKVFA
nr:glycosyltransferase family 8 protein [Pseudopedobacter sp.]